MCGITGIISGTGTQLQRLQHATRTMRHRGPEGEGFFINETGTAALGHQRLCIIDLSPAAKQPMTYGRYTIVYNGELYNYLELKEDLESKGFGFTTTSDTEVLIASYAAYGADCLQKFDGAFSFAIWDEEAKVLFAARDRFGEKPFFFAQAGSELFFASEMKALWAGGVPRRPNDRMVYNFLTIGYTANPFQPDETFFEGISKLPAASFLTYSMASSELSVEKYWLLQPEMRNDIGEKEAIQKFDHLLSASVKLRLRSDVSIGTSLSGGLDSSALVAYCNQAASLQYSHQCFTATFPGFERDEHHFASAVAKGFDLKHHLVEINAGQVPQLMEEAMEHQEEPIGSASALAQFEVYKAAKRHGVTVLLDGQGADEVLGGYHKYYRWYWQQLYKTDRTKWKVEQAAAQRLGVSESLDLKGKATALFPQFAFAVQTGRMKSSAYRSPDLHRDFAFRNKESLYYSLPLEATLNSALYFNTVGYGLEELLRMADRNGMANSVEVRLPFLSHQLVEFLFTLPPHLKIRDGWTKWLLRKAVEPALPKEIVWRRDKVGFEPPQKAWMQNEKVAERIGAGKKLLVEKGVLNGTVISQKIKPHEAHAAESKDWKYWAASFLYR